MTEKRFKEVYPDIIESSYEFTDNGKGISHKEVVDLLNQLSKENEQLKKYFDIPIDSIGKSMSIKELLENYEQLKKEYQKLEYRHSLLHDECLNVEFERDSLKKDVESLEKENEQLKQQLQKIQNSFEVNWAQNYEELDKDKLYIKDNNTEIRLDGRNLFIEVYIPQINEYYRFKYVVTRRSLMREFIENYNSNGDGMMTKRIDWEKSDLWINSIRDWCEHFLNFYNVSEELSDVGVTVEEVEKQYEEALVYLKEQLDKIKFKEDDNDD